MLKKKTNSLIILFLFVSSSIIKINLLSDVIPSQDQTSYIFWLQSIFNSQEFLPKIDDLSFIQSLQLDNKSVLHNLFKPIYSSTTNVFTLISLMLFSIGSLIIDASVKTQIILSILFNNISILIISLYFAKLGKKNKEFIHLSILIFIILQLNSFFYGFSTHGTHNVGIFFLIINLLFLEKYLKKISDDKISLGNRFSYFIIQGFAFYSMYTNVFLIFVCTIIGILLLEKKLSSKLKEVIIYCLATLILFLPAIIVFILTLDNMANDQGFILWGKWAFSYQQGFASFEIFEYFKSNIVSWYSFNSNIFGIFLFPLSLAGLIILKKKYNITVFLYLFISHFLISFLMAGFNYAQPRTSAYLMPVCSLGISILIYSLYTFLITNIKTKINYSKFFFCTIILFFSSYEIILNTNKVFKPELIKTDWSDRYTNKNNKYKKLNNILNDFIKKETLVITNYNSSRIILSSLNYPNTNVKYIFSVDSINESNKDIKFKIINNDLLDTKYNLILFLNSKNENLQNNYKKLKSFLCNNNILFCNLQLDELKIESLVNLDFKIYKLTIK